MTAPNPCPVCGAPMLYKYQCAHVQQRLAYATPEKASQACNECVGRTNND